MKILVLNPYEVSCVILLDPQRGSLTYGVSFLFSSFFPCVFLLCAFLLQTERLG